LSAALTPTRKAQRRSHRCWASRRIRSIELSWSEAKMGVIVEWLGKLRSMALYLPSACRLITSALAIWSRVNR
jgi:hypothetical protein